MRSHVLWSALFKRQVERKMAPSEGLFSLRLPKFESYQPGILNSPAAMLFTLAPPQRHAKPSLATPQLGREPSLLRHFGQIGSISPAKRADFDPNGFRSSSPTTPASQCGLRAVISELIPADLVSAAALAVEPAYTDGTRIFQRHALNSPIASRTGDSVIVRVVSYGGSSQVFGC
jgi:hypothetical protein